MSFQPSAAKRIGTSIVVLSALLGGPSALAAAREPDWQLARTGEKAGIDFSLYQRDVPDSGYDRYRLEAVFDAPVAEMIEALRVKRSDDRYLSKGVQRKILEWEDDHSLTYLRMDVPVVADRDITLRSMQSFDAERGVFRNEWRAANEEAPPVEKGVVRITRSEGFWEFTPDGDSRTRVVYESFSDPGGHAPGWLINSVLDEKLIQEIVILREIVDRGLPKISAPPPDGR